jgi:hypothetical protein
MERDTRLELATSTLASSLGKRPHLLYTLEISHLMMHLMTRRIPIRTHVFPTYFFHISFTISHVLP